MAVSFDTAKCWTIWGPGIWEQRIFMITETERVGEEDKQEMGCSHFDCAFHSSPYLLVFVAVNGRSSLSFMQLRFGEESSNPTKFLGSTHGKEARCLPLNLGRYRDNNDS